MVPLLDSMGEDHEADRVDPLTIRDGIGKVMGTRTVTIQRVLRRFTIAITRLDGLTEMVTRTMWKTTGAGRTIARQAIGSCRRGSGSGPSGGRRRTERSRRRRIGSYCWTKRFS
jgi:hypothetical protein